MEYQVETDSDKIKAVLEWIIPNSTKDLQSFLGFCNYYRRFIDGFDTIVKELEDLCRKTNIETN